MDNTDNMITLLDAMMYAREGKDPSKAIENQEKRGQQSVVKNQRLPKKSNENIVPNEIKWNGIKHDMDDWEEENKIKTQNIIEYTKQQYEKMGIDIVEEYDDLFYSVILPEGWEIKATDHSMWNNLFDNKGRKRANFFYKAAFYDRDAFINFDTRFHLSVSHVADASDYDVWKNSDYQGVVKDGEEVIFSTECVAPTGTYDSDDKVKKELMDKLKKYIEENYPDYKNIHAYWD